MNNILVRQSYFLQSIPLSISSTHLAPPFIVITISMTIFPYAELYIFFIFTLLYKYICLPLPSTTPSGPTNVHLPPSILPTLTFSIDPLYIILEDLSPFFPVILSTSSLITVSLCFISMSPVIFLLLV